MELVTLGYISFQISLQIPLLKGIAQEVCKLQWAFFVFLHLCYSWDSCSFLLLNCYCMKLNQITYNTNPLKQENILTNHIYSSLHLANSWVVSRWFRSELRTIILPLQVSLYPSKIIHRLIKELVVFIILLVISNAALHTFMATIDGTIEIGARYIGHTPWSLA